MHKTHFRPRPLCISPPCQVPPPQAMDSPRLQYPRPRQAAATTTIMVILSFTGPTLRPRLLPQFAHQAAQAVSLRPFAPLLRASSPHPPRRIIRSLLKGGETRNAHHLRVRSQGPNKHRLASHVSVASIRDHADRVASSITLGASLKGSARRSIPGQSLGKGSSPMLPPPQVQHCHPLKRQT